MGIGHYCGPFSDLRNDIEKLPKEHYPDDGYMYYTVSAGTWTIKKPTTKVDDLSREELILLVKKFFDWERAKKRGEAPNAIIRVE